MNILILSAATGGGHIEASKALEAYIMSREPNANIKVVDGLKYINMLLDKIVSGSYLILAKYLKTLYKGLYKITDRPSLISKIVEKFTMMFSKKLLPLINEFQPDVIITTHPFVAGMISTLKRKGSIDAFNICILTDYEAHDTWLHSNIDAYCVAWDRMKDEMIRRGIDENIIYPLGIPVNEKFFKEDTGERKSLLRELNLHEDKKVLLVMAGSFGVNNIETIYKQIVDIPLDFQVVILTGNNQRLYNKIRFQVEKSSKETRIIKFTKDVYRYMKMADVLITKPGGLTVSEALASNLPLIVFDSIPGQEEANAKFLLENGMAVSIGKGKKCRDVIEDLIRDKERLKELESNCRSFDKSKATEGLMSIIIENTRQSKNSKIV